MWFLRHASGQTVIEARQSQYCARLLEQSKHFAGVGVQNLGYSTEFSTSFYDCIWHYRAYV